MAISFYVERAPLLANQSVIGAYQGLWLAPDANGVSFMSSPRRVGNAAATISSGIPGNANMIRHLCGTSITGRYQGIVTGLGLLSVLYEETPPMTPFVQFMMQAAPSPVWDVVFGPEQNLRTNFASCYLTQSTEGRITFPVIFFLEGDDLKLLSLGAVPLATWASVGSAVSPVTIDQQPVPSSLESLAVGSLSNLLVEELPSYVPFMFDETAASLLVVTGLSLAPGRRSAANERPYDVASLTRNVRVSDLLLTCLRSGGLIDENEANFILGRSLGSYLLAGFVDSGGQSLDDSVLSSLTNESSFTFNFQPIIYG